MNRSLTYLSRKASGLGCQSASDRDVAVMVNSCPNCAATISPEAHFCTNCGGRLTVDGTSNWWHWLFLALAFVWALLIVAVCLRYHVPEPNGVRSITTNGHTYDGNPPALTLLERDPVSFAAIVVALGAGLVVATTDVALRTIQRSTRVCVAAVVIGVVMVAFSFFGLLLGLASLGVVGTLLALSGQRLKSGVVARK